MWFGATAACVLAGVVINAITAANSGGAARAANTFAFFTTWSNLLVGSATLLLAVRLDRSSTAFAVLRLSGLVAIIATGNAFAGVAFDAEFAQALPLTGWGLVWNVLLHIVVPVMAVVGWLLIGPRRIVSPRVAWLSVLFPVCYIAFALIRGAIDHWYPYPFIDVTQLGYGRAVLNCVPMPLFTLGLAAAATVLDGRLARATSVA